VKLVKHQINGDEHVVLKDDATPDDLRAEADRMHAVLGYEVQSDERLGQFVVSHPFFHGRFVLTLEGE
jgi:hypothetical protein